MKNLTIGNNKNTRDNTDIGIRVRRETYTWGASFIMDNVTVRHFGTGVQLFSNYLTNINNSIIRYCGIGLDFGVDTANAQFGNCNIVYNIYVFYNKIVFKTSG